MDAVTAMLHLLLAEVQSFKYTGIMSNVCFKLFCKLLKGTLINAKVLLPKL